MDQTPPRSSSPVLDYGTEERSSPMRAMGRLAIPTLGILGIAMIAFGIVERGYQSLTIAGSVLVGSIIIASALRDRR